MISPSGARGQTSADAEQRGVYPINHMITVRNDLVDQSPGLLDQLFAAFTPAKQAYVEHLAGPGPAPSAERE